jgi:hypothetical protein
MNPRAQDQRVAEQLRAENLRRAADNLPKIPAPPSRSPLDDVCPPDPPVWLCVAGALVITLIAVLLMLGFGVKP